MLEVIQPGSEVWIGHEQDPLKGIILEVCIKQNNTIQYRVSWWASRERRESWFESFEIDEKYVSDKSKTKIGFAPKGV